MSRIVGLKILSSCRRVSLFDNLGFHPGAFSSSKFISVLADKSSIQPLDDERTHSSTASFLVNSCGFPSKIAQDVASKVKSRTLKNPNLVLSLLQNQGFAKTQISKIVKEFPLLLFYNSTALLPKFEFLHSIGLSNSECVHIVCSCPCILGNSLKNNLIPRYNYLKSVLVRDEKVLKCLKRSPRAFRAALQGRIVPNIELLRTSGVSEAQISFLVSSHPGSAFVKHSRFCSIVNQVRDMGFDPLKLVFVEAIRVISEMTPGTMERKFEVYRKYGLSKDQTLEAFKKQPICLALSEENICKTLDFFVHKIGLKTDYIASNPVLMCFSLEKRIIPRWSVVQSLYAKGLLKKEHKISSVLKPTEKIFMERYVTRFSRNVVTCLLHLYTGKVKVFDV